MVFQVRDALKVGAIALWRNFLCSSAEPKEMLKTLSDELRNFCVLIQAPLTPFGKAKKTYSGKVGGRQDDICITLQLAVTGCRAFYQSERYASYRPALY